MPPYSIGSEKNRCWELQSAEHITACFFMCRQDCGIPQRAFWKKPDFTISCP